MWMQFYEVKQACKLCGRNCQWLIISFEQTILELLLEVMKIMSMQVLEANSFGVCRWQTSKNPSMQQNVEKKKWCCAKQITLKIWRHKRNSMAAFSLQWEALNCKLQLIKQMPHLSKCFVTVSPGSSNTRWGRGKAVIIFRYPRRRHFGAEVSCSIGHND